jgi:predicted MFS family arabinose efflux permease
VAIPFGWRWAFVVAAALAVVTVAFLPRAEAGKSARPAPKQPRRRGFTSVHALAVAAALASAATLGLVAFLVTYSVDSGMSESAAGVLLAALSLASTISRIGFGFASDRAGREPLRATAFMLALSAPGFLLLIAGTPVLIAVAALFIGGVGWAWSGALTQAAVQRSPDAPGWAVSVVMAGLFAGAVTGPIPIGFLAEHDLFEVAWVACTCLTLLAAAMLFATLRREGSHKMPAQA